MMSQCGIFVSLTGQYRTFCLLSLMLRVGDIISASVSTDQQEVYTTEQLNPSSLIHCSHSHKLTYMTHTEPSSVCYKYDRYITTLNKPSLYTSVNDSFKLLDSSESFTKTFIQIRSLNVALSANYIVRPVGGTRICYVYSSESLDQLVIKTHS